MKIIKIIILLVISILCKLDMIAQNNVPVNNQFLDNAISQAVCQYHQQKSVGRPKYMVVCMKIFRINETSGEFVLRHILNDYNYDSLQPTHYMTINKELVLIKADSLSVLHSFKNYGIVKITKNIKIRALSILATNLAIIEEEKPLMVFKYVERKLDGKLYNCGNHPTPKDEYLF